MLPLHASDHPDLGQFERFRRIMHIPEYRTLLNHQSYTVLSKVQVCDD
jgi:hypothetical protein